MLKKIIILLFIVLILPLFTNIINASETAQKENESLDMTSEKIIPVKVKYDLAFPGLLPNHPLYKLKVLRDKISLALINDPRKKIDFYLLKTDKEILATAMLVDKNEYELAEQTALKAEHNYTLLTRELHNLSSAPKEDLYKKLETASLKHQEVLESLAERAPKDKKKTFLTVIDFSKRNWESVEEYREMKEEQQREQREIEEERKMEEQSELTQ
ncbi:MAG: DUF5667 domain-containing protein [Candidatus Levybacteria bacterium]|nr:DUF5667 domain-containing protein [Candidatus Levybacteria bacterium]